jgi:imidazolonepropionase
MHLSPEGAVTASTVNAAWAMGRGRALGSLEPGKQADLVVLNVETPAQIPYFFGVNPVRAVVKRGKVVVGDAVAVTTAHVRSRPGSAGPSAPRGE